MDRSVVPGDTALPEWLYQGFKSLEEMDGSAVEEDDE